MKTVKIIATVAVVLLLAGISWIVLFPLYCRYLFSSNRITGTIFVTVDGEKYDLKDGDVTGLYENSDIGVELSNMPDGARVSTLGGDYGPYTLSIHIEGMDTPLTVVVYQYNWWNVTEFDLTVSVDTSAGKISIKSKAKVLNETIFIGQEEHSTEFNLSDENITHIIVSI